MADRSVAIRLGMTGAADVKRDLNDIGDAGDASAKRWSKAYDAAGEEVSAAIKRQAQAADKLAAITPQTQTQAIYQAGASTNFNGQSARDSAAAFRELLAAEEALTTRSNALRASIDPAVAAQQRFDREMVTARDLISRGGISLDEYCAKLRQETAALGAASRGHGEHANMLGLNRSQFITAESAVIRFSDSIIAGANPLRAFALEAHKGVEVLSLDEGGMAGGLTKLRALLNPGTLGLLAVTAGLAVGTAAWYSYSEATHKLDRLSEGTGRVLGLTGDQLEATAQAAADASNVSVSSARDIEASYLGIAKSGEVLTGLTAITRDFAAATGQDLKGAQEELGKAFTDPIKGAEELAGKYGVLTQAQIEHIAKLAEEGDQTKVQIELLHDLGPAFQGAADNAGILERAWHGIKKAADDAFNAMGHAIDVTLGGGSKMEQIEQLSHDRSKLLQDTLGQGDTSSYDRQIASLQTQLREERDKDQSARRNAVAQSARGIIERYSGDKRPEYQEAAGKLRAALGTGSLTPDETNEATKALEAYTHAIDTFTPAAEKANLVVAAQAKVRQATTPAARAAAQAELLRVKALGEVVTAQDVQSRAEDRATGFHNRATNAGQKHAETLAREAAAMEANARGSIALADAYLRGGDAAIVAEARRKAATDATKKGIDIEAQSRRQLDVLIGDQIANSAKAVGGLRDENDARAAVLKQVQAGDVPVSQMNRALQDEAALRPLLKLQALAQGDALKELTKVIAAYRVELARSHEAEAAMAAETMIDGAKKKTAEHSAQTSDLRHTPLDRALNAAQRAANEEADDKGITAGSEARIRAVAASVGAAQARYDYDRAAFVDQTLKSQRDSLEVTQAEVALVGVSAEKRSIELDKLRASQEIRRSFPDMSAADVAAILAGVEAQDKMNAKLAVVQASMDEIKQTGEQFLNDLTNPDGSGIKNLLKDIEQEFEKLALLNPLKNLLFHDNAPKLGSVFGSLGSLFGGPSKSATIDAGGTSFGDVLSGVSDFGHNASGTENWSGGKTWINENGPELVDLPSGSRIIPAAATSRMLANDNGGGRIKVDIGLNTDLFTATVAQTADGRIGAAAPIIGNGAADLANARSVNQARRRMR